MNQPRWAAREEGLTPRSLMFFRNREVSSFPLLFQESAAATKATPRTLSIATCVCAATGDTAKGEWWYGGVFTLSWLPCW